MNGVARYAFRNAPNNSYGWAELVLEDGVRVTLSLKDAFALLGKLSSSGYRLQIGHLEGRDIMIIKKPFDAKGPSYILVDDLNPEDNAMFQALYARSAAGAEPILDRIYAARRAALTEVLDNNLGQSTDALIDDLMDVSGHNDASALARRIHNDYTVKYGHKSIADCGSTTLCVESCSMLAAKAIQDWPLYCGQETSTRAIDMSKQRIEDPFNTPASQAVLERWMDFYVSSQKPVEDEVRRRYPRQDGEDEKDYEGAVKYRVFDITRAFLPAGATTNVSWHTNLRQAGDHLTWMKHHPLAEVRDIAEVWSQMLRERYPSSGTFGGGAGVSGVGADGQDDERAAWYAATAARHTYPSWYKGDFGFLSTLNLNEDLVLKTIQARSRGCVLPHWMSDFGQLRFFFNLDFGSFRDLQRHRNGVVRMPPLTTLSGFEPWYLEQLPSDLQAKAKALIEQQNRAIHVPFEHAGRAALTLPPDDLKKWPVLGTLTGSKEVHPEAAVTGCATNVDAQYLVAMGQQVSCTVTMGLPAFVYFVELRSTKSVHPTLRAVVHRMIRAFQASHPEVPLHVDMTEDPWNVRRGTQTIERKVNT